MSFISNVTIQTQAKSNMNHSLLKFIVYPVIIVITYVLTLKVARLLKKWTSKEVSITPVCEKSFHLQTTKLTRSCSPKLNNLRSSQYNIEKLLNIACKSRDEISESIRRYRKGGYMPVTSELIFGPNNRFKVLRKLGWGSFSTAWLAKDLTTVDSYLAVKVLKSNTQCRLIAFEEIILLDYVKKKDPSHPGYNKIVFFYDMFYANSIYGPHPCLTFELMGSSLFNLIAQSDYRGLEQSGVKNIIRQILVGLSYLHDTCKIIHSDLKPENILITIKEPQLNKLIKYVNCFNESGLQKPKSYVTAKEWNKYKKLKTETLDSLEPNDEELLKRRINSCPSITEMQEFVKPLLSKLRKPKDTPMFVDPNIQVKIADLGNSCWEHQKLSTPIQTLPYRALEVIIQGHYSYPVDLWSVACIAIELCTGNLLFSPQSSQYLTCVEDHIGLIWRLLGGIPPDVALSGDLSSEIFFSSGTMITANTDYTRIKRVREILKEVYEWEDEDASLLGDFVESLLNPYPDLRPNAIKALSLNWLKEANL